MVNLLNKIEDVMYDRNHDILFSFKSLLTAIASGYECIVRVRNTLYKKNILQTKRLPCTVISIGNITVGGTGKTPMTIYVAKLVKKLGYKVAIISRGYKGKLEKTGGIVSDGENICVDALDAGDEPYMIASKLKTIPVVVGSDRFKAGSIAVKKFSPDVIILDDAFQHLKLLRNINLILLDHARPFGNSHLAPRGILREPVSSLLRSDAVIFTRSDSKGATFEKDRSFIQNKPIFKSFHKPYLYKIIPGKQGNDISIADHLHQDSVEYLKGKHVVAFSGIAKNDDFPHTIGKLGCTIKQHITFTDHYPYSDKDLDAIFELAENICADCVVTTEKDYMRVMHMRPWSIDLAVIGVEISFGNDSTAFYDFIKQQLLSCSA
jgi:tetraacyldisaccharide 4'-kinase